MHKGELKYTIGDATKPIGGGTKLIIHVCNDQGAWGAGFVLALDATFGTDEGSPRMLYRNWAKSCQTGSKVYPLEGGQVQLVPVTNGDFVVNMIGQHGTSVDNEGFPPIRYPWIDLALKRVAAIAHTLGASVHCPRFGSGLAGGNWNEQLPRVKTLTIEERIKFELVDQGIDVTVYDLPK